MMQVKPIVGGYSNDFELEEQIDNYVKAINPLLPVPL
jgi:hypothetical protein